MAQNIVIGVEGDKVRFVPNDRNAAKGVVGLEGEIVKRQDFIVHVKVGDERVYAQIKADVEVIS